MKILRGARLIRVTIPVQRNSIDRSRFSRAAHSQPYTRQNIRQLQDPTGELNQRENYGIKIGRCCSDKESVSHHHVVVTFDGPPEPHVRRFSVIFPFLNLAQLIVT